MRQAECVGGDMVVVDAHRSFWSDLDPLSGL